MYEFASSDWLRLGPMKIQVNSENPSNLVIKELIYQHECDQMQKPLPKLLDKRSRESHGKPNVEEKNTEWIDIRVMKKYA